MRDSNRGRGSFRPRGQQNRFGGRPNFSDRNDRQMYDAVCDNCGKACKVPFEPRSGKPVYCSDCFEKMGDRGSDNRGADRGGRSFRPNTERPQNNVQMDLLNAKLDRIIDLLTPKSKPEKIAKTSNKVTASKE